MMKICKYCGEEFESASNAQKYCSKECSKIGNKEKKKETDKKYREEHKNENKDYYEENKEKIKEYKKKWEEEHREEINVKCKEYQREKRKDPIYRLNSNISRGISHSLKDNGLSKGGRHWENLVPYTSQELQDHLESLFTNGMTWENQGLWHLDHITPKSSFDIKAVGDKEFQDCWSLDNLQPLWAKDNLSKGDRLNWRN